MKVLLVSMPFSPLNPSSQLGVLKGYLLGQQARSYEVQSAHLFVHLAARTGLPHWETLSNTTHGTKVGNLLFQQLLFDLPEEDVRCLLGPRLLQDLQEGEGLSPQTIEAWQQAVGSFWADLLAGRLVDLEAYQLFGFSTVFNQLFPSLALARELKQRSPSCRVLLGGVEVHGDCGISVMQRFPFVDAVVQGRGELPLAELLQDLASGGPARGIPGVLARDDDGGLLPLVPRAPGDAAVFGLPDHSEFFRTLEQAGLPQAACTGVPIEASQGCYWRRCDFCGTREVLPCYRVKEVEQIRSEVTRAVELHGVFHIIFTDEAVPVGRLIPALEALEDEPFSRHLAFLAQIRAGFNKEQIAALARCGLRVAQVGIESFSTEVLARMDKGTTALQNLRCLKWCSELGIRVDYNLILGYPFASDEELDRMIAHFPLFWHLDPPQPSDFYLNRFSLLFASRELRSELEVRPSPLYNADILPDQLEGLRFIAYSPSPRRSSPGWQRLRDAMALWRRGHRPQMLYFLNARGFLQIFDRRGPRGRSLRLSGLARELYLLCDDIRTPDSLREHFGERIDQALQTLEGLIQAGLIVQDPGSDELLSLAPCFHGRVGWA